MDAVDYRDNLRVSAGRMKWWTEVDKWKETRSRTEEEEELVEVLLRGKAPWGFTLRGGTEHREPLIITKVETGSVAAAVRLQAGDEMVSVNAVPLSGSRQEAICLVKSSYKTLSLVVRSAKMVDVVSPRTMPSETEVHVARSFLTKILRSSMRKNRFKGKNDPDSRPHSWHSTKLTEEEPDPGRAEAAPPPLWQSQHEARPGEPSSQTESVIQQQQTAPFSMERLERTAQPYPPGRLSPTKYGGGGEPFGGPGAKRDSALSCFSSSSPPLHDRRRGTSTESIFFKGIQSEGLLQAERLRYLQPTLGGGGWEGARPEEQPASRVSFAGRPSIGPVWQVPEKKKSHSPPPPPPPLRSDSFVATKVFPYSEGPGVLAKSHGRSVEKLTESSAPNGLRSQQEKASEARRSLNPLPTKDFPNPPATADHNHNQLHPNKLFSLSSCDVRQSHYAPLPAHQRQYSDESPLYLQTRTAPPAKTQSVGSYYRSLQDLPTNAFSRKHGRQSAASSAGPPNQDGGGHSRYWQGLTGKHFAQVAELKARQGKPEGWRGETEKNYRNSKAKYPLPQSQLPYSESKERNGHSLLGNGLHYDHQALERPAQSRSPEDAAKRSDGLSDLKRHHQPSAEHQVCLPRHQDPWVPQEDHRISPLKTPLLHSLAQESRSLAERQPAAAPDAGDAMAGTIGKAGRRSDRYATTLRKEIQQKRAQLQKSRSAATLTCEAEEEEAEEWRSVEASAGAGVSFSNTYKDHLKEAQARVLQATSFQRRDLEPVGPEAPAVKASNGRVRGRKRFHLAKRTHSFSEPDKIDKVGVEGESQTGSFDERRKLFEAKPSFCRPVLKTSQRADPDADDAAAPREPEDAEPHADPDLLSPGRRRALLEQQRLGTFAEYQATWSKQKKSSEGKAQGRYHSAENILDAGAEETAVCVHERSRSSPSADFYAQGLPSPWSDSEAQQSSSTTRVKTENRPPHESDHSPQQVPSVPRNEGIAAGLPDHRSGPDAGGPAHIALSSGPRSLSPQPGSEPPQTKSLLPPPRLHLGPETTSSSQEFLAGAQAEPAALQPLSGSDTQHHAAATPAPSAGHAPAGSPRLGTTSTPDVRKGVAEHEEEKDQPGPTSSSSSPSLLAALGPPSAERARSPSPQFAPLRLTDKPPAVSVQDESVLRPENEAPPPAEMDVSSPVRKVPVRIVHAESSAEREGRAYLQQSSADAACSIFQYPPQVPSLSAAERPGPSLFSAYTRQAAQTPPAQAPESAPSAEDAKREELARDIMGRDKSLVDILDQSGRKTTMDLMEGLFPQEEQILEGAQQRRRASAGSRLPTASPRSTDRREEEELSGAAAASLVPSSSYYNTSAPKAELLIKMKDMQEQLEEQDSEDELDVDLASKKQELISSLARKLEVLREARQSLQEDVEDNEALGREVEATVQRLCQPNQLDKFRMFVGDLDKVVSLLLSLSGRLARVENALNSLEDEAPPEEKRTLTEKRKLLMRQHEDAKELKENLDRRERLVSGIMAAHLDAASLDDYRHFVKMKSALIIEQRKLEDKIKLGEEQLKCLLDSLPLEQRPLL